MTRSGPGRLPVHPAIPALLVSVLATGCATLQQLTALQHVDFALDRVTGVELAGVDLFRIRGFDDLSLSDGLALADAVRQQNLDLDIGLSVRATNPSSNIDARLVRLDWTLFLEDRETVSGRLADEIVLPSGESTYVPVSTQLNLVDFFDGGARDLFELAYALTGNGSEPQEVTLSLLPTIQTVLGPITYEAPIRVSLPSRGS